MDGWSTNCLLGWPNFQGLWLLVSGSVWESQKWMSGKEADGKSILIIVIYIYILLFFHNDPRQYDCDYMNRFLDYITETCDRLSDCYYIAEALPCITSCIILNQL